MLLQNILSLFSSPLIVWVLFVAVAARALFNKYGHGLNKIPGPRFAAFTDLWRCYIATTWEPQKYLLDLHKNHGDIVRIGPRSVSVSNLEIAKKIYGPGSAYKKSNFYRVLQNITNGEVIENIFDTTDNKFHAQSKRWVASFYSMTNVVPLEAQVDSTIVAFKQQLDQRFVDSGQICDFHTWLQYFAFDVVSEITFSKRIGFIDTGSDVSNAMADITKALQYFSVIGQMPWLDRLLLKNPIRIWLSGMKLIKAEPPVFALTSKLLQEHVKEIEAEGTRNEDTSDRSSPPKQSFVRQFLKAREKNPSFITDREILQHTNNNIFAGSDTTGLTLSAIFYFLLKNPRTLDSLMDELDRATFSRDDGLVTWTESQKLPYLTGVINEALRLHSPMGLTLERVVPAGGLQVGDYFLPPGTIVGTCQWTLHCKSEIFGPRTNEFRPERWIDEGTEEQRRNMKNSLFSFGWGSRSCIGKNVSLLEIYKLVPTLLRSYKISLAFPEEDWKVESWFLCKQRDFRVVFKSKHA